MPAASLLTEFFPANELLPALLELSPTGIVCYTPLADATGTVVDLAFAYLNPAAQRLLALPAQPAVTYRQHFAAGQPTDGFAAHHAALLADAPQHFELPYPRRDGQATVQVAAQRVGTGLLVSFSADAGGPAAAQPTSQTTEQQNLASATRQYSQLQALVNQAPVAIGFFEGPEHHIAAANDRIVALWGRSQAEVLGYPLVTALPELRGQGFDEMLTRVYTTGVPVTGTEVPATMMRGGQLLTTYYNFVYQPLYDEKGAVLGVVDVAVEVTDQVLARQQVQQLNAQLAATNEALEAHVAERTQALQAALRETEQQREQLRTQQNLLNQILGQVPAAIATLAGPEHRYMFFNTTYQGLASGRTQVGRTVAEVFPEVVSQGFVDLLNQVYTTGQPFLGTETPALLYDAETGQPEQRYLDFIYQPIGDEQEQPRGILAFVVDATEKVLTRQRAAALQQEVLAAAQRQAQERENLYQIFEQTPAAICLLRGPEHRVDYLNPAYQQLFRGRQMLGRTVAETQPESAAQGFLALLDQVYETGEAYFGNELPLVVEQGEGQPASTFYFNFTYQPYHENGVRIGISVFAYDVTEQVLARRANELQRQLLNKLFMEAPVPITILDGPDFVFQLVNPAYQRIFPGRALQGQRVLAAMPELADSPAPALLTHVYQTGETYVAQEFPLTMARHQDGPLEEIYFTFTYQARRNAEGVIDGIMAFAYDVTDQVLARHAIEENRQQAQALANELAATNQRLTRTNADLDTFVYTASHDLKAPITNLEGLLTALREQLPAEAQQVALVPRLLAMMDGAVARFQETLAHLTDVSKLQPTDGPPAEAVDLPALIKAVRLDLAAEIDATQARLVVEVADCPTVYFAPKNLRSIVYNLLSNALKYRDPDRPPVVQLRCHRAGNQVVLTVQDNGLGLDTAQQAKLFGMFRRLHTHVPGSGVGLYMVKKIVENAGGNIAVQSQPNQGSTFTVAFPA